MEQIQKIQESEMEKDFQKSFDQFYQSIEFLKLLQQHIEVQISQTSLKELGKIKKLEDRLLKISNATCDLELEASFFDRGSCHVCGELGYGIMKDKTCCSVHGFEESHNV